MAKKRPSETDRLLSHVIVALIVGFVGNQIKGAPGAIAGAVLGVIAHEELDAPVAQMIADLA